MHLLVKLLVLVSVGKLHASLFNLNTLEEEENYFNGQPNISTSGSVTRPIGAVPPPLGTVGASILQSTTSAIKASGAAMPSPHLAEPEIHVFDRTSYNNRPAKKARTEDHIAEVDLEKYIEAEVNYQAFKKAEKKEALRRAIELIAKNDLEEFTAYEPVFEAAFRHGYHAFKRSPKKTEYMMHYIIRFGATTFTGLHAYKTLASKDSNIESAYEYLIATKPLDVVIKFIKTCRHVKEESVMKAISKAVQKRS